MRVSLIVSFLIHCSILLAGAIVLPSPEEFVVDQAEAIPVDIIDISEFTKNKAETPDPKPEEAPKPEEQKQAALEPEVPPEPPTPEPEPEIEAAVPPETPPEPVEPAPAPEPEVKPEPKPEPVPEKKVEPKPEPEKKVETKPVPRPRVRPRPPKKVVKKKKKPKFDLDKIAALLNKDPSLEPKETQPENADKPAPGKIARRGLDDVISRSERDALNQLIKSCMRDNWNPLVGTQEAEELVVRIKFSLKRDGTLRGTPKIANPSSNATFQAAADRAMRAIRLCQPFELPADKYNVWRDIILNFNPREMIQG